MVCSALTCEGLVYGKLFMMASLRNAVKETAVKVIISLSLDLEATPRPKPSKPLDSLYLFIYLFYRRLLSRQFTQKSEHI